MERTATIHEVLENDEFIEKARCPFCHRPAVGTPVLRGDERTLKLYDKHLIRVEHGCGGNIAIFRRDEPAPRQYTPFKD